MHANSGRRVRPHSAEILPVAAIYSRGVYILLTKDAILDPHDLSKESPSRYDCGSPPCSDPSVCCDPCFRCHRSVPGTDDTSTFPGEESVCRSAWRPEGCRCNPAKNRRPAAGEWQAQGC